MVPGSVGHVLDVPQSEFVPVDFTHPGMDVMWTTMLLGCMPVGLVADVLD